VLLQEIDYDELDLDPEPIGSGAFGLVYRCVVLSALSICSVAALCFRPFVCLLLFLLHFEWSVLVSSY
jgi:hypothetical protein